MKGKKAKKEALTNLSSDSDFLLHINFLLNPYVKTGISDSKIKKKFDLSDVEPFETTNEVIEYLSNNFTGRDKDIIIIQKSIQHIAESQDEEKLLIDFFTKKLRLGFTGKTVNEVIPNLIPIFSPMLAEGLGGIKDPSKLFKDGYVVTLKLDGVRCVAIKRSPEDITLFTRQGREIIGVSELINLYKNPSIPNGVYDGEILAIRKENETTDELFRRTIQLVNSHTESTGLQHILFDTVFSPTSWDKGNFTIPYNMRRLHLEKLFDEIDYTKTMIGYLPTIYTGEDITMIPKLLDEYSDLGYEGIMLNTKLGKYVNKRTKDLVKAKKFDSADLLVTGIKEGQGRLKGTLGTITVDYKGYSVDVSGFNDEERRKYYDNPELIIGKIVEISFQSESSDVDGNLSMRFPVFKGVRLDKTVEDIRYSDNQ